MHVIQSFVQKDVKINMIWFMQKNSRKYCENVKWKKKLTVNSVAPGVAVEEVEAAAAAAFFLLCNFDEKILFGELNFFSSFSKKK